MKKVMLAVPALALAAAAVGPLTTAQAADSYTAWSHIVNVAAPHQVLDGTRGIHGSHVLTYQVHSDNISNQLWRLQNRANGTVAIVNKEDGMCLASMGAHHHTVLNACDFEAVNQEWFQNTRPGGLRGFASARTEGMCLALNAENAPTTLNVCDGSPDQTWRLVA